MNRKPRNYWTKDRCKEVSLKYSNRRDFQKSEYSPYHIAWKKGWLDEICEHMKFDKKPRNYWSKERCKKEASKYTTLKEFRENSSCYRSMIKNGWKDEICKHLKQRIKPYDYWTLDRCKEVSKQYPTRTTFGKAHYTAYQICLKSNWIGILYPIRYSNSK